MYVKIHHSYRNVVGICDSNLIGKKFEEGKLQLDVRDSFYKGEDKTYTIEEVKNIIQLQIKEDATFNIVGEKSIKAAIEIGLINENAIGKIQGIPFAMTLL